MRRNAFVVPLLLLLAAGLASCSSATSATSGHVRERMTRIGSQRYHTPKSLPRHTGRVLYVAPDGSDAGPGSRREPFATFQHALSLLQPGDVLCAEGGTYYERVKATRLTEGTPERRILVTNCTGERVVIKGEFWLAYPSYWTIDGINVTWDPTNPPEHMVQLYGGTGWVLEHSEIWGEGAGVPISKSGLLIGDGDRNDLGEYTVRDNCIHDNETNLYLDDSSRSPNPHGVIERNLIFGAYDGRGIKLGPPGDTGGPKNVVIWYNTIYGGAENISLSRDATGVVITRNILAGAALANIGTFKLRGSSNIATDNLAYEAPRFSDVASLRGPNNRTKVDPAFDAIGCDGFHPTNPAARRYGRYASAPRTH